MDEIILFVDIFSFLNEDYYERFLLWLKRILTHSYSKRIDLFIDNAVTNPHKIGNIKHLMQIISALSDVKTRGIITLHAMNIQGKNFAQAAQSVITMRNYEAEKCAIVSSEIAILCNVSPIKVFLLCVDGKLIDFSEKNDVLIQLCKDQMQKEENSHSAIPDSLLNKLFDN
jgi:hypothetical protein